VLPHQQNAGFLHGMNPSELKIAYQRLRGGSESAQCAEKLLLTANDRVRAIGGMRTKRGLLRIALLSGTSVFAQASRAEAQDLSKVQIKATKVSGNIDLLQGKAAISSRRLESGTTKRSADDH
jgi:hypothetical protein